jgi:hypothetical protein
LSQDTGFEVLPGLFIPITFTFEALPGLFQPDHLYGGLIDIDPNDQRKDRKTDHDKPETMNETAPV